MSLDPLPRTNEPERLRTASSPASDGTSYKFVSFFLGEKHYAMPAQAVAEVVGHLTPTRLPDTPHSLLGIAPLRGDILAVVDAGASTTAAVHPSKQKAVVLRPIDRSVELPIAFNIDRLGELVQLKPEYIRFADQEDPLAEFEAFFEGRSILIIAPERIQDLLSATAQ